MGLFTQVYTNLIQDKQHGTQIRDDNNRSEAHLASEPLQIILSPKYILVEIDNTNNPGIVILPCVKPN